MNTERTVVILYINDITEAKKSQFSIKDKKWQSYQEAVVSPIIKRLTYYKWLNRKLAKVYNIIGKPDEAKLTCDCGSFVRLGTRNGHEVIKQANFCRKRLCFVCSWRKSRKFISQMMPVMKYIEAQGNKFIFLTLTMENCTSADVKNNLGTMLKAWDKFLKRRPIKRAVKGYCRSLEVTYNKKENTYHPHIHALLVVDSNYFISKDYLSHEYLMQTWKECLDINYDPIVDIRKVRRKNNTTSITAGATVETLKYSLKILPPDITTETVICLDEALRNRRLLSFGGIVAEVRTLLRMEDIEDSTLTDGDDINNAYDCLYIFSTNGWSVVDQAINTVTGELTPLF